MKFLSLLPASALVISFVACTSDPPDVEGSGGGTAAQIEALRVAYAAHCARPGDSEVGADLARLQAFPGVYFDAAELSLCTQALNAGNCTSVHCSLAISEWGTRPVGAGCNFDAQCTSSICLGAGSCQVCVADRSCTTPCATGHVCNHGVCMVRPTAVAEGGACKYAPCEDGLLCRSDVCVPGLKVGDTCSCSLRNGECTGDARARLTRIAENPCVRGAQCNGSQCVVPVGEGGACAYPGDCAPPLVCGESGTCRKAATVAMDAPCYPGDVCTGGTCRPYPKGGAGTCDLAGKAGESCGYVRCEVGLVCNDRMCATPASILCK